MQAENKKGLIDKENEECDAAIDEKDIVQSCAVIRKAEAAPLVPYQRLELNTNLNLPPSNWLNGRNSFRFINTIPSNCSEYSSFRIAHQNLDLIGDVDVVSWAQNVKTLLKIPYNTSAQVSLMLHRVGNTLLIDEFDLNHLLRNSNVHWEWFKKFFSDNIYNSFKEDQKVLRPNKSRSVVVNRNLQSKFLYYSLGNENVSASTNSDTLVEEKEFSVTPSFHKSGELEAQIDNSLQNEDNSSVDRHVIWNFEDIKMLIGTDMPIFEGKDNLCISLRLNEISKPINILTGLDYWLDNLMSNVPEIVMCCHLKGLVKAYHYLKTEDLPNLPDSKFSPKEVLDVARNILDFLNAKATKEGHTYWLFKAENDFYVKLYDLTSLSTEPEEFCISPESKSAPGHCPMSKNPFAFPVAILCYRVAEGMSSRNSSALHAHICSLLKNALEILNAESYPQFCCTANCLMSDAYLPRELNPQSPHLSDVSDSEDEEENLVAPSPKLNTKRKKERDGKEKTAKATANIPVNVLSHPYNEINSLQTSNPRPPPLDKDLKVRCAQARDCVINAFKCIDQKRANDEFEAQQKVNPSDPIPMPYAPLHKKPEDKGEGVEGKDSKASSLDSGLKVSVLGSDCTVYTWLDKVTVLLLQKIYQICLTEAKLALDKKNFGSALKHIKLALHSVKAIETVLTDPEMQFGSPFDAYVLAGFIYDDLSQDFDNIESHVNEFTSMDDTYLKLKKRVDSVYDGEVDIAKELPTNQWECVQLSLRCLSTIMNGDDKRITSSIRMKYGKLCVNVGTHYMGMCRAFCESNKKKAKKMEDAGSPYENAVKYFEESRKTFALTKDPSHAWVNIHVGHFYRVCASYHGEPSGFKSLYVQAIILYKTTLRSLVTREANCTIWDRIQSELVKTLKSNGVAIIESLKAKNISNEEEINRIKQVDNLFKEACEICTLDIYKNVSHFSLDFLEIHTRWAKMYHKKRIDKRLDTETASNYQKLADQHYDLLFKYYESKLMPYDCITITVDRIYIMEGVDVWGKTVWNTSVAHIKILILTCLPLLIQCKQLRNNSTSENSETANEANGSAKSNDEALRPYYRMLSSTLLNLKQSVKQCRIKKKRFNEQLLQKLHAKCLKTPVRLDDLIGLVELVKSDLVAHL